MGDLSPGCMHIYQKLVALAETIFLILENRMLKWLSVFLFLFFSFAAECQSVGSKVQILYLNDTFLFGKECGIVYKELTFKPGTVGFRSCL